MNPHLFWALHICTCRCSWNSIYWRASSLFKPVSSFGSPIWLHSGHFYCNHATKELLKEQTCKIEEIPNTTANARKKILILKKGEVSQLHCDSNWKYPCTTQQVCNWDDQIMVEVIQMFYGVHHSLIPRPLTPTFCCLHVLQVIKKKVHSSLGMRILQYIE